MKLQEFQSKMLLARYGIPVPRGDIALTADDARRIAFELNTEGFAVKAQVPAGGRGRSKGVVLVSSPEEAGAAARAMLGRTLVTEQTGPVGYPVRQVLVEEAVTVDRSLYLAILIDTARAEMAVLAGPEGSEEIEDKLRSAETTIERLHLAASGKPDRADAEALALRLELESRQIPAFVALLEQLASAFVENDATLIELNPLAITKSGAVIALDAKIISDDNAMFRHPDLMALRDEREDDGVEVAAQSRQLNYVRMDGNIGVVANGAGLGLATLDMICAANGRPANFMDIRTTANSLDIAYGCSLLLENPAVRAILVNVHGGGMQPCDTIADGLGIATRRTGLKRPTIVRLAGNNAEYARFRLQNFGVKVIDCPDMWSAVTRAVATVQDMGETR
ncbi:ADP-forming succinate--CoA ligase subunit beta [Chelativorans sp. YIM 93263]|uniref:ADP-forming succinate--CoA ligase subunit beta n=1 Tax=Chelativorans sp. YIM 93263 TaxID=2906648 RepID=UPI002378DD6D|nr:ADP-forming succinate--CoA ligase subunit beta [Chelativorans sp. YIM 93263]